MSSLVSYTDSRLAVYETRLDTLEEMVLDLSQVIPPPPPPPLPPPPPASTQSSPVRTSEDYEDLGGRDFSMLGLSSPGELDRLEYDCLVEPCDLSTNINR